MVFASALVAPIQASEISCESTSQSSGVCLTCLPSQGASTATSAVTQDLPEEILDFGLILKAIKSVNQKVDGVVEQYKPVARYISPIKSSLSEDKAFEPALLVEILSSAESLKALYEHSDQLHAKINTCYNQKCPRSWILADESEAEHVDLLIALHLSKHPILASKNATEYLKKSKTKFERRSFEKVLYPDFVDFFNSTSQLHQAEHKMGFIARQTDLARKKPYLELVLNEIPQAASLVQSLAKSTELSESEKQSYCRIQSAARNLQNLKIASDVGVNVILLAAGGYPLAGQVLAKGATSAGRFLASRSAAAGTTLVVEGLYGVKTLSALGEINKSCESLNASRFAIATDLQKYEDCLDRATDKKIEGLLAATTIGAAGASPALTSLLGKVKSIRSRGHLNTSQDVWAVGGVVEHIKKHPLSELPKKTVGYQFNTDSGTTFTYLDLSKKKLLANTDLEKLPDNYWDYVSDVYTKKLNLSKEEIKEFIDESHELASRSKLLVASKGAPHGQDNLIGGITVVESKSSNELLPLEIATGVRLPRHNGKVVELGRLIVTEGNGGQMLGDIFNIAVNNHLTDPAITRFYAITSKSHVRIYRRTFNFNMTPHPNGRDVILDGDPKNLFKKSGD